MDKELQTYYRDLINDPSNPFVVQRYLFYLSRKNNTKLESDFYSYKFTYTERCADYKPYLFEISKTFFTFSQMIDSLSSFLIERLNKKVNKHSLAYLFYREESQDYKPGVYRPSKPIEKFEEDNAFEELEKFILDSIEKNKEKSRTQIENDFIFNFFDIETKLYEVTGPLGDMDGDAIYNIEIEKIKLDNTKNHDNLK